jgi:hypothetical protein
VAPARCAGCLPANSLDSAPQTPPRPDHAQVSPDLQNSAAQSWKSTVPPPGSGLSQCSTYSSNFETSKTQQDSCINYEGDNLGFTNNKYTEFSNSEFIYTDGATGKQTPKPWSWSPGSNDVDMACGQCVNFEDCDGGQDTFYTPQGGGTVTGYGAANLIYTNPTVVQQGQNAAQFYWEFDDYPAPTFSACDDCDFCQTCGYNPMSTNQPQMGVIFSFDYSCTVTPK